MSKPVVSIAQLNWVENLEISSSTSVLPDAFFSGALPASVFKPYFWVNFQKLEFMLSTLYSLIMSPSSILSISIEGEIFCLWEKENSPTLVPMCISMSSSIYSPSAKKALAVCYYACLCGLGCCGSLFCGSYYYFY